MRIIADVLHFQGADSEGNPVEFYSMKLRNGVAERRRIAQLPFQYQEIAYLFENTKATDGIRSGLVFCIDMKIHRRNQDRGGK